MFDELRRRTAAQEADRFEKLAGPIREYAWQHFERWYAGEFGESIESAWPGVARSVLLNMYGEAFEEHKSLRFGSPAIPCRYGYVH